MSRRPIILTLIVLVILAIGFGLGRLGDPAGEAPSTSPDAAESAAHTEPQIWTCSMHPQIQLPEPGKCPICSMDLIPLEEDEGGEGSEVRLSMSEAARKLAEVQTTPVRRGFPEADVRLVGKVAYDETRLNEITAWVGGRLDRLYVDYVGIQIRRGDHMAELYSPELLSAQEELLQAARAVDSAESGGNPIALESARRNLDAARDKLRLLGLEAQQIEQILERGTVVDTVEIRAPIDGIVVEKHALEGNYVKTGSPIYTIADLTEVWVKMDAYESDLVWLRYGQKVTFHTEAYPGQRIEGRISFIDPVLDQRTQTAKVRVNVDNPDLLLKPGMFVRAVVHPQIAAGGRVMAADLEGKWISPMHPEVIKDGPGSCDVCGMPLVPIESMGYRSLETSAEAPLLIPASAPLITGKRAVVYVRVPDVERPTYEGREVVLGPRAKDAYIVESGLNVGEEVVVHGAFKIDSAMQIQAKPSMMLPEGGASGGGMHKHGGENSAGPAAIGHQTEPLGEPLDVPAEFRERLGRLTTVYLDLTEALAADDEAAAREAADALAGRLEEIDMGLLEEDVAHMQWMGLLRDLEPAVRELVGAESLEAMRVPIARITPALATAIRTLGAEVDESVRRFHCPMAMEGAGADWLQSDTQTANPYYGASMLRCGEAVETLVEEEGEQ